MHHSELDKNSDGEHFKVEKNLNDIKGTSLPLNETLLMCESSNESTTSFASTPDGNTNSSMKSKKVYQDKNLFPPSSVFHSLPPYVQKLLIKGGISSRPTRLSPYHCVLTCHPVHRESTESDVTRLVESIRTHGYLEACANKAPLVAVKYSKPQVFSSRFLDSSATTVYDKWSDHPLFYAIAGAGRIEAIAKFFQSNESFRFVPAQPDALAISIKPSEFGQRNASSFSSSLSSMSSFSFSAFKETKSIGVTPTSNEVSHNDAEEVQDKNYLSDQFISSSTNSTSVQKDYPKISSNHSECFNDNGQSCDESCALGFYILTAGENLSGWELFLLSIALNNADPSSRPLNYFERTDQIVFICFELSKRKQCDASYRDIAIEICTNPFLSELERHLRLDAEKIVVLFDITDSRLSREVREQLTLSRTIFHWLPPNMGVIPQNVPQQHLEVLDVMIDMATCVNANKMKYSEMLSCQTMKGTEASKNLECRDNTNQGKAEGFLHSIAEDQLRYLFTHIIPPESASKFEVLVIRDLVSAVFGAIQECSFLFKQVLGLHRSTEVESLATCPAASAYWIERIVYETSPGGLLAGLWNFPAAALVILFYIYFVNSIQTFDKKAVQSKLLNVGTVLYRCIAELALTIRASNISLMTAPVPVQIRILEGAAILFRLALFGVVYVECVPPHPYEVSALMLNCSLSYLKKACDSESHLAGHSSKSLGDDKHYPIYTFTDFDSCYDFLYTHWFKNLIYSRLPPTQDYRLKCSPVTPSTARNATSQSDDSVSTVLLSNGSFRSSTLELTVPCQSTAKKRPWYEARRIEVAATANRLRQEIESIVSQRNMLGPGEKLNERIHVRRMTDTADPHHITLSCRERPSSVIEVEILDPSVLPMANSAKLEFLSLVESVVTMLLDRHRCWNAHSDLVNNSATKTQFLSVPANMIVLAAIKVALTFISPHFDRLAPHLVHWISVRCRLILWIWRECRSEVMKRVEERWEELWLKHYPKGPPAQRLKIRFTSIQSGYGHYVDLTPTKLAKVVLGVLPGVLQSMIEYYEKRENEPDDVVTREFFARWLKSTGDHDLVAQVNALLMQPSPTEKLEPIQRPHDLLSVPLRDSTTLKDSYTASEPSVLTSNDSYHTTKAASHETKSSAGEDSSICSYTPYPLLAASGGIVTSSPPSLLSDSGNVANLSNGSLISQRQNAPYRPQVSTFLQREPSLGKRNKKNSTLSSKHHPSNEGVDDFLNWLDNLNYAERLRLDGQEIPQWQLPKIANVPPPDLLLWKCPEPLNPFTGNGLKGTPYDRREWQRFYMSDFKTPSKATSATTPDAYVYPLSDLDWKVTAGVLKLLIFRGIDTLASRHRGKVFFLDHSMSYSKTMEQLGATSGRYQEIEKMYSCDTKEYGNEEGKKRGVTIATNSNKRRKTQNSTIAVQKRYGPAFSKTNDLFTVPSQDLLNDHIADLDAIRLFLEHDLFH